MRLICPSCHAHASIEAWLNDADARQALAAAAELPGEVAPVVLRYLGLFRPAQRSLGWKRSLRLITDISGWLHAGRISHRGREWAVTPAGLRTAIDTMLARRDKLDLPINDHAYLLTILCGQADKAEAVLENKREADRKLGAHRKTDAAPVSVGETSTAAVLNAVAVIRGEAQVMQQRFNEEMTEAEARKLLTRGGHGADVIDAAIARYFE